MKLTRRQRQNLPLLGMQTGVLHARGLPSAVFRRRFLLFMAVPCPLAMRKAGAGGLHDLPGWAGVSYVPDRG